MFVVLRRLSRYRLTITGAARLGLAVGLVTLTGCGGDSGTSPEPQPEPLPGELGTVGAAGGQLQTTDGGVSLSFPPGAVSNDVTITVNPVSSPVEDENLAPGTVYEFGPSGTRFSQPVELSLRFDPSALPGNRAPEAATISTLVDGVWQTIDSDFSVESDGRVTGSITGFSQKAVTVDPCWPSRVNLDYSTSGSWAETDCMFTDSEGNQKYEDIYEVSLSAPTAVDLTGTSEGTRVIAGWTSDPGGPSTGEVYVFGRGDDEVSYRTLLAPGTYRIWMGRDDGVGAGAYSFSLTSASSSNDAGCGGVGLVPPFSSSQALDASVDCLVEIQYSPFPEVIGLDTIEEYFVFKGFEGVTYSITATRTGGDEAFAPFPTVFLGQGQVVQYLGDPSDSSKSISFTPSATRYFTLGVASVFGPNQTITEGTYTLSVSGG